MTGDRGRRQWTSGEGGARPLEIARQAGNLRGEDGSGHPGPQATAGRDAKGMAGRDNTPGHGEVYLEFQQIGRQVKVIAIDAATGVEVSVFGPANVSRQDLQRLAVRKLQRRLESGAT